MWITSIFLTCSFDAMLAMAYLWIFWELIWQIQWNQPNSHPWKSEPYIYRGENLIRHFPDSAWVQHSNVCKSMLKMSKWWWPVQQRADLLLSQLLLYKQVLNYLVTPLLDANISYTSLSIPPTLWFMIGNTNHMDVSSMSHTINRAIAHYRGLSIALWCTL